MSGCGLNRMTSRMIYPNDLPTTVYKKDHLETLYWSVYSGTDLEKRTRQQMPLQNYTIQDNKSESLRRRFEKAANSLRSRGYHVLWCPSEISCWIFHFLDEDESTEDLGRFHDDILRTAEIFDLASRSTRTMKPRFR